MSGPPNQRSAPVTGHDEGREKTGNDDANHQQAVPQASDSPWYRCTRKTCGVLSHQSVVAGMGGDPQCLACGFAAVRVSLADERQAKAGG